MLTGEEKHTLIWIVQVYTIWGDAGVAFSPHQHWEGNSYTLPLCMHSAYKCIHCRTDRLQWWSILTAPFFPPNARVVCELILFKTQIVFNRLSYLVFKESNPPWSRSRPQCWTCGTGAQEPSWFPVGLASFPHSYGDRPRTAGTQMDVDWPWPLVWIWKSTTSYIVGCHQLLVVIMSWLLDRFRW